MRTMFIHPPISRNAGLKGGSDLFLADAVDDLQHPLTVGEVLHTEFPDVEWGASSLSLDTAQQPTTSLRSTPGRRSRRHDGVLGQRRRRRQSLDLPALRREVGAGSDNRTVNFGLRLSF
jgi:hypothetical protein